MIDIWVTSDTHFGHANCLKFTDKDGQRMRPEFQTCFEMDECMIERWNSVVKPQDKVYHLGDVTFRYDGYFQNIMGRLNGHKRLVVGNHDKLKNLALTKHFDKAMLWCTSFKPQGLLMSHIPLRKDQLRAKGGKRIVNVHGHLHRGRVLTPECKIDPDYLSVCVELRDYTPVHLDTLIAEAK